MPRVRVIFAILALLVASLSPVGHQAAATPVRAQTASETFAPADERQAAAAEAARELSRLEAARKFGALYDRLHPDSRALVPREAVVGWYEHQFEGRRTAELRVTAVEFTSWTWEVTGDTYPRAAAVSFVQPYWIDGVRQDVTSVVHLVADDGEWKWFFGGSVAFVQQQIELYAPAAPDRPSLPDPQAVAERAARFPDPLHAHVDAFWAREFAKAGRAYQPPGGVVGLTRPTTTACGRADPVTEAAFYCVLDGTIYYSVDFREMVEAYIGDYGWVVVVAHEWGHHIQVLNGINLAGAPNLGGDMIPIEIEQQADCLAGAYTRDAERVGWLDPGDIEEALVMTEMAGDPAGTAWDDPYAHGSGDERVAAFEDGFVSGVGACQMAL